MWEGPSVNPASDFLDCSSSIPVKRWHWHALFRSFPSVNFEFPDFCHLAFESVMLILTRRIKFPNRGNQRQFQKAKLPFCHYRFQCSLFFYCMQVELIVYPEFNQCQVVLENAFTYLGQNRRDYRCLWLSGVWRLETAYTDIPQQLSCSFAGLISVPWSSSAYLYNRAFPLKGQGFSH